jgi:Ca2+-binding EF-hand superfamily protein
MNIHVLKIKLESVLCAGNGYITTTVLREILKELDDKLTSEDLDLMIEEIDSDGSGTVDFDGKPHHSLES